MNMFLRFHLVQALTVLLCGHLAMTVATCSDMDWMHEDNYCRYPLHWAALSGDVGGTLTALQMGKDINEKIPGYGTPLHQAAFYGRATVVKVLLQHGADVTATDMDGDIPLKATRKEYCLKDTDDRSCLMNPSDYTESIKLLTSGCETIGCNGQLQCHDNKCVNLCDGIRCGFNAVCSVHNNRGKCRCNGDDYSGDPTIMCLKMGDAKYIYKAYCFVRDVVTNISSAIINDIKSFMKK